MRLARYYPNNSMLDSAFSNLMPSEDFFSFGNSGINLYETESKVIVEMEVPGMDEDDIDVNVSDGVLNVMAQNTTNDEERKNNKDIKVYTSSVRNNFNYSTSLPSNVDTSKVEADINNGILTVSIDKAPESQPKKIKVNKKS